MTQSLLPPYHMCDQLCDIRCRLRAVSSFFVDQARGSFHAPRDVIEEDDALIYGARLEFTGRHTSEDDAPW